METPGVPEVRPLLLLGSEELLEGLDNEIPVNRGAQCSESLKNETPMVKEGENHLLSMQNSRNFWVSVKKYFKYKILYMNILVSLQK